MPDPKAAPAATASGNATADIPGIQGETGIATQGSKSLAEFGQWSQWLLTNGAAELPTVDPSIISARIMEKMLSAETPAELFQAGGAYSFEDLEGVPFEATKVYPMQSRFEKGPGVFMIIDGVRLDTGEAVTVTCGALNVMSALCAAQDRGWVRFRFIVVKAEHESGNGYRPYIVKSVPAEFAR